MTSNKKHDEGDLGKTLKLLALVSVNGMKLKEQVSLMSRAGFNRSEMALLLGTTPNSIGVRLNELKAAAKRSKCADGGGQRQNPLVSPIPIEPSCGGVAGVADDAELLITSSWSR